MPPSLVENNQLEKVNRDTFSTGDTIVTNLRHHEQLVGTKDSLHTVIVGIDAGVTKHFTAINILARGRRTPGLASYRRVNGSNHPQGPL